MHSVQAPLSGASSPIAATTMHHDALSASMSSPHYQQHAYDSARDAAAQAVASSSKHLLPSQQPGRDYINTGGNVRAWPSDSGAAGSSKPQLSPVRQVDGGQSPHRMVMRGSNSPLRQQVDATPVASTSAQIPMPTTAASLMREGPRDFTVIKDVGDGTFGTVCLADWRSPLPSGTLLSPMQHPTTRPEYLGKRLVAIKKMKKPLPSWEDCLKLKELKCLLAMPHHPNIIPLYDAFLMPVSKELHFVFECMEGNLYQLTKSRRGRPLASGLVASIFQQIVKGLHHIHDQGYFHRDMKPENLLITTTGLADYPPALSLTLPGIPTEKDVLVIVKLADFGLARETDSQPPYTEYVSTRWYRAPEILLRSRDYSNPVDLWALGTILAELITLKPLFPGQTEIDQVMQICEVLGDPTREYGRDGRGRLKGGGEWARGVEMARKVGFTFPKTQPIQFSTLFSSKVPEPLIDCVQDLLRYDPDARLTTQNCLDHPYFTDIAPRLQPAQARAVVSASTPAQQATHAKTVPKAAVMSSIGSVMDQREQRSALPPSHSTVPPLTLKPGFGEASARTPQDEDVPMKAPSPMRETSGMSGDTTWAPAPGLPAREMSVSQYPAFPDSASLFSGSHASMHIDAQAGPSQPRPLGQDVSMQRVDSRHLHPSGGYDGRRISSSEMELTHSSDRNDYARRAYAAQEEQQQQIHQQMQQQAGHLRYDHGHLAYRPGRQGEQPVQSPYLSSNLFPEPELNRSTDGLSHQKEQGRGKGKGWGLNISSVLGASGGAAKQPSAAQGQGEEGDGMPAASSVAITPAQRLAAEYTTPAAELKPADAKKAKKLAEKAAREAEKAKRAAQEKAARERARAVMQKRNQILASSNTREQVEWLSQADNETAKAALLPATGTPLPMLYPSDVVRGKQPSMVSSATSDSISAYLNQQSVGSPYSPYSGQSSSVNSPAWQASQTSSRGMLRKRDYEEGEGVGPYLTHGHYGPNDPRRQSMQSFQTGDSDPGPGRTTYVSGSALHTMHRHDSTSSLNSAPGLVDGASSRTRFDDRNSIETRSIASSLDHQLIQNMENMSAAERSHRHRTGSASPGPMQLMGQRSSQSRQSHGSRASSAQRQGSASPLHHPSAPRFHPYSASNSGPLGSPGNSSYSFNLPSLASIAQGSTGEPLHTGGRPKSLPRRSSVSQHRGVVSRGSVASGDGVLPPRQQANGMTTGGSSSGGPVHPMFHVQPNMVGSPPMLPGMSSPASHQHSLPPFSQLAAAAGAASPPTEAGSTELPSSDEYYANAQLMRERERSQGVSQQHPR